jgi:hypothetical protein
MTELMGAQAAITIDPHVLEVEKAQEDVEVQMLLAQKRAELGLAAPKAISAPVTPVAEVTPVTPVTPVADELATRRLETPREEAR